MKSAIIAAALYAAYLASGTASTVEHVQAVTSSHQAQLQQALAE